MAESYWYQWRGGVAATYATSAYMLMLSRYHQCDNRNVGAGAVVLYALCHACVYCYLNVRQ